MAAESTITSPTDPAQLVGLYCLTAIVAQRGVTLVLKGAILDEDTAKRIWHREYLRQDLRFGCRKFNGKPVDVLQASQAKGSKLVDVDGNVY
jgi:hypothetical protein